MTYILDEHIRSGSRDERIQISAVHPKFLPECFVITKESNFQTFPRTDDHPFYQAKNLAVGLLLKKLQL